MAEKLQKPKKKTIEIKYADKSAGQPAMVEIFEALKALLVPYFHKREIQAHEATYGQINLVSHKPVLINGVKKEEVWFVSLLIQKGYVGFYFMPIYCLPEVKEMVTEPLLKCLKGKSCFHIKKLDDGLKMDIKKAIKIGFDVFVQKGWL